MMEPADLPMPPLVCVCVVCGKGCDSLEDLTCHLSNHTNGKDSIDDIVMNLNRSNDRSPGISSPTSEETTKNMSHFTFRKPSSPSDSSSQQSTLVAKKNSYLYDTNLGFNHWKLSNRRRRFYTRRSSLSNESGPSNVAPRRPSSTPSAPSRRASDSDIVMPPSNMYVGHFHIKNLSTGSVRYNKSDRFSARLVENLTGKHSRMGIMENKETVNISSDTCVSDEIPEAETALPTMTSDVSFKRKIGEDCQQQYTQSPSTIDLNNNSGIAKEQLEDLVASDCKETIIEPEHQYTADECTESNTRFPDSFTGKLSHSSALNTFIDFSESENTITNREKHLYEDSCLKNTKSSSTFSDIGHNKESEDHPESLSLFETLSRMDSEPKSPYISEGCHPVHLENVTSKTKHELLTHSVPTTNNEISRSRCDLLNSFRHEKCDGLVELSNKIKTEPSDECNYRTGLVEENSDEFYEQAKLTFHDFFKDSSISLSRRSKQSRDIAKGHSDKLVASVSPLLKDGSSYSQTQSSTLTFSRHNVAKSNNTTKECLKHYFAEGYEGQNVRVETCSHSLRNSDNSHTLERYHPCSPQSNVQCRCKECLPCGDKNTYLVYSQSCQSGDLSADLRNSPRDHRNSDDLIYEVKKEKQAFPACFSGSSPQRMSGSGDYSLDPFDASRCQWLHGHCKVPLAKVPPMTEDNRSISNSPTVRRDAIPSHLSKHKQSESALNGLIDFVEKDKRDKVQTGSFRRCSKCSLLFTDSLEYFLHIAKMHCV